MAASDNFGGGCAGNRCAHSRLAPTSATKSSVRIEDGALVRPALDAEHFAIGGNHEQQQQRFGERAPFGTAAKQQQQQQQQQLATDGNTRARGKRHESIFGLLNNLKLNDSFDSNTSALFGTAPGQQEPAKRPANKMYWHDQQQQVQQQQQQQQQQHYAHFHQPADGQQPEQQHQQHQHQQLAQFDDGGATLAQPNGSLGCFGYASEYSALGDMLGQQSLAEHVDEARLYAPHEQFQPQQQHPSPHLCELHHEACTLLAEQHHIYHQPHQRQHHHNQHHLDQQQQQQQQRDAHHYQAPHLMSLDAQVAPSHGQLAGNELIVAEKNAGADWTSGQLMHKAQPQLPESVVSANEHAARHEMFVGEADFSPMFGAHEPEQCDLLLLGERQTMPSPLQQQQRQRHEIKLASLSVAASVELSLAAGHCASSLFSSSGSGSGSNLVGVAQRGGRAPRSKRAGARRRQLAQRRADSTDEGLGLDEEAGGERAPPEDRARSCDEAGDDDDDDVDDDEDDDDDNDDDDNDEDEDGDEADEDEASEPELKVCEWEKCGNTFLDMDKFVAHLSEQHVNREPREKNRYFCLWANCKRNAQEFNARYKLLIHMRVHSGEKPYSCSAHGCKKSFSRLENLKIHNRSHTGEKPYKCSYDTCLKSFTNSSDRIKHHKTHKDPKPYTCTRDNCSKRYTDPSSLRKHLRAHNRQNHALHAGRGLLACGERAHQRLAGCGEPAYRCAAAGARQAHASASLSSASSSFGVAGRVHAAAAPPPGGATVYLPADYDPTPMLDSVLQAPQAGAGAHEPAHYNSAQQSYYQAAPVQAPLGQPCDYAPPSSAGAGPQCRLSPAAAAARLVLQNEQLSRSWCAPSSSAHGPSDWHERRAPLAGHPQQAQPAQVAWHQSAPGQQGGARLAGQHQHQRLSQMHTGLMRSMPPPSYFGADKRRDCR